MNYKKDISKDISVIGQSSARGTILSRDRNEPQRFPDASGATSFNVTLPKKCDRLATAIYLVTNFLSDTEPMKSRLRVLSLDFVRDASLLRNGSRIIEVSVLDALRSNIAEVLSLLELALVAGIVSEMNFTLLKREYISLRDMVDARKASHESHTDNVLGDNFFGSSFHAEENIGAPASRIASHTKPDLAGTPAPLTSGVPTALKSPHQMSFKMSDNKVNGHTPSEPISVNTLNQSRDLAPHPRAITDDAKESRRARILKLIKDNHEVAIRDIVEKFPDLSEKTIQRELVTMSDSGVLKKSGERRWSRYTLA